MLQGKLDFAIFPAPVTHKDITFLPLGDEEILFAFSEENQEAMSLLPQALTKEGINLAFTSIFLSSCPRKD